MKAGFGHNSFEHTNTRTEEKNKPIRNRRAIVCDFGLYRAILLHIRTRFHRRIGSGKTHALVRRLGCVTCVAYFNDILRRSQFRQCALVLDTFRFFFVFSNVSKTTLFSRAHSLAISSDIVSFACDDFYYVCLTCALDASTTSMCVRVCF